MRFTNLSKIYYEAKCYLNLTKHAKQIHSAHFLIVHAKLLGCLNGSKSTIFLRFLFKFSRTTLDRDVRITTK
jgi:hypothetical protein